MSAATLERPATRARSAGTTRTRQLRPGRGSGRGGRPVARSVSGVRSPAISGDRHPDYQARACSPDVTLAPAVRSSAASAWRLTNRGIALVLITGAVLAAAAITVITATAVTVTSDGYHSHGSALVRH